MDDTPDVSMVTARDSPSPPLPPCPPPLPPGGIFYKSRTSVSVELTVSPPLPQPGKVPQLSPPSKGVPLPAAPPPHGVPLPAAPPPHGVPLPAAPPPHGVPLPAAPPPHGVPLPAAPPPHGVPLPAAPPPHGVPLPAAPPPHGVPLPAAPPPHGVPLPAAPPPHGVPLPAAPPPHGVPLPAAPPPHGVPLPAAPPLPPHGVPLPVPSPPHGVPLPAAPPLPPHGVPLPAAPPLPPHGVPLPAAPPLLPHGVPLPAAPPLPPHGVPLPAAPPLPPHGVPLPAAPPLPPHGVPLPAAPPLLPHGVPLPAAPPLPPHGVPLPVPSPPHGVPLPAAPPLPPHGVPLPAAPPLPPHGVPFPPAPPLPPHGVPLPAAAPSHGVPLPAAPPPPSHGIPFPAAPLQRVEQRRPKLRNFNWEALPAERVLGGCNLWTCGPQGASLQIDVVHMEELFGQREEHLVRRGSRSFRGRPYLGLTEHDVKEVSLLDSKRSMNLGIFLKQFKRPVPVMIRDIRQGVGSNFGAEKLGELQRLLPEKDEVKRLRAFKGERSRLNDPELFMVMLVEIPSFRQRLEVMILKEEFFPQLNALKQSVEVQMAAATELMQCEDLHMIIHLVLKAGNYMNAGGYAGSAMGFRMGSLLRLADTKANKPGMNLMHFVAREAERNNRSLLSFPEKLPHISQASRITSQEVESDLETLSQRLQRTRESLRDQPDLRHDIAPFLQVAEVELCEVLCILQSMRDARRALMDYFCEDESTFRLEEMCLVFTTFCAKFMSAIQENREREKAEHRKERLEKRRSIASCSSQDKDLQDVELEFLMLRLPRRVRPSRGPRALPRSYSTEVLNTSPTSGALHSVSTSANLTVEPIREEDDHITDSRQNHGLRRQRKVSTEGEGRKDSPGKMNRRHTFSCLPSYGEDVETRSILATSPVGSSKDSLVLPCKPISSSTPRTPNACSLSQTLKSRTADISQKDPPSSLTPGTPSTFRLGGLFHRRGSFKSPEPLTLQVADGPARGSSSEASALTSFLRRFDNALRSPKLGTKDPHFT